MGLMRRLVVAWGHICCYADGHATATVVPLVGETRVLVVDMRIHGEKQAAVFRYRGDPELHRVVLWLESVEEKASRISLRRLMINLGGPPPREEVRVLH